MTGLVFNGIRVFNDAEHLEGAERAADAADGYNPFKAYDEYLEWAYQRAMENAHDEWWDTSAPDRWEFRGAQGQFLGEGDLFRRVA